MVRDKLALKILYINFAVTITTNLNSNVYI